MMNEPGAWNNGHKSSWIKLATKTFALFLIISLFALTMLSTSMANSTGENYPNRLVQVDTETPTATSTVTPTSTLAPVTLSFQNGVLPSASYNGSQDTYISEADINGNYGQSTQLKVNGETTPGSGDANHALIKWDISQIPPGSQILSASLSFNVITTTVDVYPVYQLTKPWVFNQANWINYAAGTPWELPGATGPTDRGAQILTGFAPANTGIYTINLNRSVVQFWVDNPAQNYGLIISNGNGSTQAVFDSAESANSGNRPKLTVEFSYPPGTTPTPTITATATAITPAPPSNLSAVAVSTSQINLTWTDNSDNETGFEIERSTDNTNWSLITTTAANVTTYSDTGLATNTTFFYRVRATGTGGKSAFSNVASASTTPTVTPTVSGTPPTPTVTGTVLPNLVIIKSVSPAQASVGQLFNFAIQISNTGTSSATDAILVDTFPSVLTLTGAQTNRGTFSINTSTNTITFSIGTIAPNEVIRLGILAQVNNTATTNANYNNSATLSFKIVATTQTLTSNTVAYRVLGTSTLPGTGMMPFQNDAFPISPVLMSISLILAFFGIAALLMSFWASKNLHTWTGWFVRTGVILLISAGFFGLLLIGVSRPGSAEITTEITTPIANISSEDTPVPEQVGFSLPTPTPENLPDFPIPSPTHATSPGEEPKDVSPIEKIMIPSLDLDTVVKYVPYDGFTWAIAGLKQEVAWMGDTSWPGLGGNTGLAGHVTLVDGSDGPFRYLQDLVPGDPITLITEENIYTYKVRSQIVVNDDDFSVIKQTDHPQLTLITCTNWDTNIRIYMSRLVVLADLEKVEPIVTAQLDP